MDVSSNYRDQQETNYTFHVSREPAFVYVNNPKCGCSTTKASINIWHAAWHGKTLEYQGLADIHSRQFNPLLRPVEFGSDAWEFILRKQNVFRFSLLREPVSRLVSAYYNKLNWGSQERLDFNRQAGRADSEPLPFETFLSLIGSNSALRDLNEHWRLQCRQISLASIDYDFICLTGNLDRDLIEVRNRVFPGLKIGIYDAARNMSASGRFASAMVEENIAAIREIYADDIELYENTLRSRRGVLSDLMSSALSGAGFVFVPGMKSDQRISSAGPGVKSAVTSDGLDQMLVRLSGDVPNAYSGGKTGGFSIQVPDAFEAAASARTVTIRCVARAVLGSEVSRFAIAYSTNDVGNSGWRWFDVASEWSVREMSYDVPRMKYGGGDFIGLLPSGTDAAGVEIAAVAAFIS